MSEVLMELIENTSTSEKTTLLQSMYQDVDECFDNFSDEQVWQVKNYIESYMRELSE